MESRFRLGGWWKGTFMYSIVLTGLHSSQPKLCPHVSGPVYLLLWLWTHESKSNDDCLSIAATDMRSLVSTFSRPVQAINPLDSLLFDPLSQIEPLLFSFKCDSINAQIRSSAFLICSKVLPPAVFLRGPYFDFSSFLTWDIWPGHLLSFASKQKWSYSTFLAKEEMYHMIHPRIVAKFLEGIQWRKKYEIVWSRWNTQVELPGFVADGTVTFVNSRSSWRRSSLLVRWRWEVCPNDVFYISTTAEWLVQGY